jgi:hypothetical protein
MDEKTVHPALPESHYVPFGPPRPLSIGLAAAIVLVVAIGLQTAVPMYQQHAAIRAIEKKGGSVDITVRGPEWLRRHIGTTWMCEVTGANLTGKNFRDGDLDLIARFPRLKTLALQRSHVTDSGLARLAHLSRLEMLFLGNTAITDGGLEHLARLPHLKWLDLDGTVVTDQGLIRLAQFERLEGVGLNFTKVADKGTSELRRNGKDAAFWRATGPGRASDG